MSDRGKCSNCNKALGDAFTRVQVMAVIDGDAEDMDHDDVCHRCEVVVSKVRSTKAPTLPDRAKLFEEYWRHILRDCERCNKKPLDMCSKGKRLLDATRKDPT